MVPLYLKKNDAVQFLFFKKASVRIIKHENTVESGSMNKSRVIFRERV